VISLVVDSFTSFRPASRTSRRRKEVAMPTAALPQDPNLDQPRPGLVTWAASQGAPDAVELLVLAGFDVNSFGRSDAPVDQPWHSALHVAAGAGNLRLAEKLLELGADPRLRDRHYDATPLGWARHFRQQPLIDLLQPHTEEPGM
jgi:ankyrin repeat protein